ncbi:MAG: hypothetical protein ACP5HG_08455 [Anaerolineae bacterium]
MRKPLKFKKLLAPVRQALDRLPEHRSGKNTRYSLTEAGLSAFAVFYMQSPSFLAHQRDMQRQRGRNNVQSLFGVERIPSDSQLRNLLDPVDPAALQAPFWEIYAQLVLPQLATLTHLHVSPTGLAARRASESTRS